MSAAEDRYLMTVIATASNPRFSVSRVDIDRPGDTYTYDTLIDIRAERGDDVDLYFITGADALDQILTWRNADQLFDLAHFVGCTRPGVEIDTPNIASLPKERMTLLEIPALSISSTACRHRVAEPGARLVPRARRRRPVHRQARALPAVRPAHAGWPSPGTLDGLSLRPGRGTPRTRGTP